ncbi:hypothetical protein KAJ27_19145 [bacterium]|nr:hypothetical protein [bacterium]
MRKKIILLLLLTGILFVNSYAFELDSEFYKAEGLFVNNEYNTALSVYKTLLNFSDKTWKYHEKTLYRIILILDKLDSTKNGKKVVMYRKLYLRHYPFGKYISNVKSDTKTEIIIKHKLPEARKKSGNKEKNSGIIQAKSCETLHKRFKSGYWVRYEFENMKGSFKYNRMTFALKDVKSSGRGLNCRMLVRYENKFEKMDMIYKIHFKDLENYTIKDVKVKKPGRREKRYDNIGNQDKVSIFSSGSPDYNDSSRTGSLNTPTNLDEASIFACSKEKLELDGEFIKNSLINCGGKKIMCHEYKYDDNVILMKGKAIYSPEIPITGIYFLKGRNPRTYKDFEIKLVDFGYSKGNYLF